MLLERMKKILSSTQRSTALSRRQFTKQVTFGVGVAAASRHQSITFPVLNRKSSQEKKLGIALVGLGYYSSQLLAPALQETERCYLAGIVTGTSSKAETWSEQYQIPQKNIYNYDSFDRIADNPDIDIVYVVLPNVMHAEYTIRAAQAGKHVICEKPMALSVQECEAMIEACQKANRKLSIGYRMQFEPTTREIMRIGQNKIFGQVMMIVAGAGYRESRADHWKVKKPMGGGAMMDMGVYSLQAARYVTGEEPISVTAQTFTSRADIFIDVDETTTFQLEFPGGALANLHTSFAMNMNYLMVTTERGWFRLDPFSSYRGVKGEGIDGPIEFPEINQQAAQMDEVAYCINNNLPMRVPGEEGLNDMKVVEAIYQSLETGRKIRLT